MIVTINDIWLYAGIGAIILLLGSLLALWWLAGGTGRFFIMSNILGRNPIGLIQGVDNKLKFHAIKTEGRDIVLKGKRHLFFIDQIHGDQNAIDPDAPDYTEFNQKIKKPVHLDNKIVVMGHEAGGVAFNPNTMAQISNSYNKAPLEKIGIVVPYSLADIYQLLRIILPSQRAETIFNAGVIKGANQRELREQGFIAVIVILAVAVLILAYFVGRGG